MANNDSNEGSGGTCCGVIQEATSKSRERTEQRRNKPKSWLVLKMTAGTTLAIIAYASYVYIGRFCVPMIRKNGGPLSGRKTGIPFLVIFILLLVMILWTYAMIVSVSPGLARDYVEKTAPPTHDNPEDSREWDSISDLGAERYQYVPEGNSVLQDSLGAEGSTSHSATGISNKPGTQGITDGIPTASTAHPRNRDNGQSNLEAARMLTRSPPKTPVLRPDRRYCHKEGFLKPLRAHHCRACGTCILKYDHHCPWIGQCVGARNHKYFVHFLQWAAAFWMWTFATLVPGVVHEDHVDAQCIVIIASSAFFTLFTVVLLLKHIRLLILNQSTVEAMQAQEMKDREKIKLSRMYSWHQIGAKRRTQKQWDQEWGSIDIEGNLWWLGSARENWTSVMGTSEWGWFLPVGNTLTDGINWLPNPRHDSEGRWRPRNEWPAALR
ncbi:zf-DHHC-domain-containing protein [Trametopsis cervina]|nr:zf-DHHC-domain-containing protein [Trametopsis cervina]